ncbi:hypothetical protein PPTG_24021 [Phytophthora nicotianae INRA-310]|uniref:Uncharacterized protein n=1 Tax=Phytophthora nicotianae (strain INRA-310) TaxID=761204 RepID=W2PL93_PHYN3|nr:hypothetical protein PPTG_24021 [Phytophthora nicotianae INRA-310]ETN01642.1 hypothetical protein PPTG_24021 [Phytophthora nicotianae INRA-310]
MDERMEVICSAEDQIDQCVSTNPRSRTWARRVTLRLKLGASLSQPFTYPTQLGVRLITLIPKGLQSFLIFATFLTKPSQAAVPSFRLTSKLCRGVL